MHYDLPTRECKIGSFLATDMIEASDEYGMKIYVDQELNQGSQSMLILIKTNYILIMFN